MYIGIPKFLFPGTVVNHLAGLVTHFNKTRNTRCEISRYQDCKTIALKAMPHSPVAPQGRRIHRWRSTFHFFQLLTCYKYIHSNRSESCIFWKNEKVSHGPRHLPPVIIGMVVLGANESRDLRAAWKEYTRKVFPHAFTQIRNFLLVSISEGRSFDDVDWTLVSESVKSARYMNWFVIRIQRTICED